MRSWMGNKHLGGIDRTGNCNTIYKLTMLIETELIEVGEDEIGKGSQVTLELFAYCDGVELVGLRFLGFDIASDVGFAIPDTEVRVSGFGGLGQDTHFAFADLIQLGIGFDHVLQTMIKGLFPGVSPVDDLLQIV